MGRDKETLSRPTSRDWDWDWHWDWDWRQGQTES